MHGVVEGVGGYGNAFGVPTVGGEVRFDASYNGNCLVNAFAAGIADADAIFYSAASGVGRPVVYLGAKTGRDGVGGATMASAEFDDTIEEKRPTVQVGDPFTEKRLMEATLELMATGAVVSIQDMGAAGLTCSAVEMGDKGKLGIRLDLDAVPVREARDDRLRDDALGEPGADAHGARPREGGRGARGLREVGPRLRGGGRDDRGGPVPRRPRGRDKGRPAALDPGVLGPGVRPPWVATPAPEPWARSRRWRPIEGLAPSWAASTTAPATG